jgi:DNA-binding FadR family transcriptional regulator
MSEVRMVLETGIVPLVCERATEEDLDGLEEICQQSETALETGDYPEDLSLQFHLRVAEATHNQAIAMIVKSFIEPIMVALRPARRTDAELSKPGTHAHEQFTEALRRRDATGATGIMREHLERKVNLLNR